MRKTFKLNLLLTCCLVMAGCGYKIGHTGKLVAHTEAIAVPILINNTSQPNLEKTVTEAIIGRLQSADIKVADKSAANLILSGKITDYNSKTPLSFNALHQIQEYRLRITAQFSLSDIRTGQVIWQTDRLNATADYLAGQDAVATQDAEAAAQKVAAYRLAEVILGQWETF